MHFRVTVRHGHRRKRYHVFTVEAADVAGAMEEGASLVPEEIRPEADLVEIRPEVDPDAREYVEKG